MSEEVKEFLRSDAGRMFLRDLQEVVFKHEDAALNVARCKGCTLDQVRYAVGIADGVRQVIKLLDEKRMEQDRAH